LISPFLLSLRWIRENARLLLSDHQERRKRNVFKFQEITERALRFWPKAPSSGGPSSQKDGLILANSRGPVVPETLGPS